MKYFRQNLQIKLFATQALNNPSTTFADSRHDECIKLAETVEQVDISFVN